MQINYQLPTPEIVFDSFNKAITLAYSDSLKYSIDNLRIVHNAISRAALSGCDKITYFFTSETKFNQVIELLEKLNIYYSRVNIEK